MAGRGCSLADIAQLQQTERVITTADIAAMSDESLAQAVINSQTVVLPDFLNDVEDQVQRFTYYVGLNATPTVLDQQHFDEFMQQNNIPKTDILVRAVCDEIEISGQEINDMFRYERETYIGGKRGGNTTGAGTYFLQTGGRYPRGVGVGFSPQPGYTTMWAVIKPSALDSVIDYQSLYVHRHDILKDFPKLSGALGLDISNIDNATDIWSIFALAIGCPAIVRSRNCFFTNGPEYVILDRSCLVVLDRDIPWFEAD